MYHSPIFALVALSSLTTAGAFFECRGRGNAVPRSRAHAAAFFPRGGGGGDDGDDDDGGGAAAAVVGEESLDDRVHAAMRRLGLGADGAAAARTEPRSGAAPEAPPSPSPPVEGSGTASEPSAAVPSTVAPPGRDPARAAAAVDEEAAAAAPTAPDVATIATRLSADMSVPRDLVLAALYASSAGAAADDGRPVDEGAARAMVQAERDAVAGVDADCPEVARLVAEGFDAFYVRRALAFAQMSVDNARAMLAADREDEEAEEAAAEAKEAAAEAAARAEEPMKTVTVEPPTGFDPLGGVPPAAPPPKQPQPPTPAKREDVIFEGTAATLQELVIESPVPVLLDVYADWCGPCKQLTPALEQICVNAGGALRLVKIDTDQERQVSAALEVKSLPTVFGLRDGKIVHMFQGLPRDEDTVRNFLMGLLVPGQGFQPPVSDEERARYDDLTMKVLQLAAAASFSFADRERLENHVARRLDELAATAGGETGLASAQVLRSLAANVVAHPFEEKYRRVKLDNPAIAARVARHPPCVSILRSLGFEPADEAGAPVLVAGRGRRVVNITPFVVGRAGIDRWIEKHRHDIAAEGRRQRDELERARLAAAAVEAEEEAARRRADDPAAEEAAEEEAEDRACVIKLRLEGKKRVHEIALDADATLADLRDRLPFPAADGAAVRFTCAARRLVVDADDAAQMSRTLAELRLAPAAAVVVRIGGGGGEEGADDAPEPAAKRGGLAARRAATAKRKSTGTHSMHSIGLYAKDDGNKAETFESGGVLYDHVLTDDEGEEEVEELEKEEDDDEERDEPNENL